MTYDEDRYPLALGLAVGNPTQRFVAERLLVLMRRNGQAISPTVLANSMYDWDDDFPQVEELEDAYALIAESLEAGEIRFADEEDTPDGWDDAPWLMLDDLTLLRMERREAFWSIDERNEGPPPAHLPNEAAIVRAAIGEWRDMHDGAAPRTDDLLDTIVALTNLDRDFFARHVLLNSLDVGAVESRPDHAKGAGAFESPHHTWHLTDWTTS